ncbi:hypothetical protein [Acrocarpospora sp. B8E8]|uniref:hypothetical protein n=1 Tax=Acrocarpospora sp. B8E8 TaxID=3153572 RepID=UPI00325FAD0F
MRRVLGVLRDEGGGFATAPQPGLERLAELAAKCPERGSHVRDRLGPAGFMTHCRQTVDGAHLFL